MFIPLHTAVCDGLSNLLIFGMFVGGLGVVIGFILGIVKGEDHEKSNAEK